MDCYIENKIEFIERKKVDGMKRLNYLLLTILFYSFNMIAVAQSDPSKVQMADSMRSNGKIYVVIAVILTILFGLVLYILRLDKKISRLEKEK